MADVCAGPSCRSVVSSPPSDRAVLYVHDPRSRARRGTAVTMRHDPPGLRGAAEVDRRDTPWYILRDCVRAAECGLDTMQLNDVNCEMRSK